MKIGETYANLCCEDLTPGHPNPAGIGGGFATPLTAAIQVRARNVRSSRLAMVGCSRTCHTKWRFYIFLWVYRFISQNSQ
jgi:hypothetical protein